MTDDPGAIIFNAMLHEFHFPEILRSCYPVENGAISIETLGHTLFGMAYFGINKFSDFRVLNFKGLELLVGSYSVPGEYAVRKLVNKIKQADFVSKGVQPSIIENLRFWDYDKRAIGSFKRQFIKVFKDKGLIDGKIIYVDGHFKPYWGDIRLTKGFSRTYGVMNGIYEFFAHDENGNAICSVNLPGDSNLLDGTDFVKKEIVTALGEEYAKVMVVDREGMSGKQLERYEDESRSILGILRHSTGVKRQLDAVEFHEVYERDKEGNPALMVEKVTLEVPNYRVEEITENGKTKDVNGALECVAIHNRKKDRLYAIAHTAKEELEKEEAVDLYKNRFPVQENDFKYKKKNGCLDTLHGYDFYEVADRQYNNWLEEQESKLRGGIGRKNAREKDISKLKGKIESIKKNAGAAYEKMVNQLLKKNKQLETVKEKIKTSVREKTKEKHVAAEKEKEEALAEIERTIEKEQREAGEKIAGCRRKIEEKENSIKKIKGEMEKIESKIGDSQPRLMFEMNTALLDFIILLLILRDNIHFSLMEEFFGEPFVKINFHTAYKCIYQQQAEVKLIGDTLHIIYIKVPGKWREDMRRAFESINARAITTPEGWRIHLEI